MAFDENDLNLASKEPVPKRLLSPPIVVQSVDETLDKPLLSETKKGSFRNTKRKLKNPSFLSVPTVSKTSIRTNDSISKDKSNKRANSVTPPSKGYESVAGNQENLVFHETNDEFLSKNEKLHPFLFPDFSFVYNLLKNNPSLKSRTNEVVITGFESYLVETWVLERELTSTLSSFSANPNSVIKCCQIYLPMQPHLWTITELKHYYKIMSKLGFLKYVNGKGFIFVADIHNLNLNHYQITNLLLIPNGATIKQVWNNFTLNLNLRELQCSGRTSAMFQVPNNASLEKFYQLYKIPKKALGVQVYDYFLNHSYDANLPATSLLHATNGLQKSPFLAVYTDVELLVYMIQTSLVFFNLLDKENVDGLLCKKTQRALVKWQKTFGAVYFPQLNQSLKTSITFNSINTNLITALLSLVMVSFYKLILFDSIVFSNNIYQQKDPFLDPSLLFKGIICFQQKLESKKIKLKSAKNNLGNDNNYIEFLDFIIIDKLFELTDDAEQTEFSQLKRFLKSTVKDLNVKKNGIGKLVSNVGTNTALATLSSNSLATNSIADFVNNIQTHKSIFKNSETLLATTALPINSDNPATRILAEKEIGNFKARSSPGPVLNVTPEIVDTEKSLLNSEDDSSVHLTSSSQSDNFSMKRLTLNDIDATSNATMDLRKNCDLINHEKTSKVKFPGQVSSLLGYIWLDINFPIQSSFSKSKNKEYSYAFYNDFVWYKYSKKFDSQLQTNFIRECKRLTKDIIMLKNEKKISTNDLAKVFDDENIDAIVETFRIDQFYSKFNSPPENDLEKISRELYNYYNYKYVQNIETLKKNYPNNDGAKQNHLNSESKNHTSSYFDLPIDDQLIDITSKTHKEIYERVQEGILQKQLENFVKREIYDPEFCKELKRRKSFTNECSKNIKKDFQHLKRSDSFSTVEDFFADLNPLIHLEKLAYMMNKDIDFLNTFAVYPINTEDNDVFLLIKDLNEHKIPNFEKKFEIIKSSLYQQLQTNNTQIEKQKKQLDSTISKYSYDTRLLERKFKNCIETQEGFEIKLASVKTKLIEEAKSKGLQYLLQLYKDDIITVDDIKNSYSNSLISNELDKVVARLEGESDPQRIIDVLCSSKLRIFYRGVHEGIVASLLNILVAVVRFVIYQFRKLKSLKSSKKST